MKASSAAAHAVSRRQPLDVERLRADFSDLDLKGHGTPRVLFDKAAAARCSAVDRPPGANQTRSSEQSQSRQCTILRNGDRATRRASGPALSMRRSGARSLYPRAGFDNSSCTASGGRSSAPATNVVSSSSPYRSSCPGRCGAGEGREAARDSCDDTGELLLANTTKIINDRTKRVAITHVRRRWARSIGPGGC